MQQEHVLGMIRVKKNVLGNKNAVYPKPRGSFVQFTLKKIYVRTIWMLVSFRSTINGGYP